MSLKDSEKGYGRDLERGVDLQTLGLFRGGLGQTVALNISL